MMVHTKFTLLSSLLQPLVLLLCSPDVPEDAVPRAMKKNTTGGAIDEEEGEGDDVDQEEVCVCVYVPIVGVGRFVGEIEGLGSRDIMFSQQNHKPS